jgi:hypothetical protein
MILSEFKYITNLIIRTDTDESWSNIMDDSDGLILIQQYNYGFLEKTLRKYKK